MKPRDGTPSPISHYPSRPSWEREKLQTMSYVECILRWQMENEDEDTRKNKMDRHTHEVMVYLWRGLLHFVKFFSASLPVYHQWVACMG